MSENIYDFLNQQEIKYEENVSLKKKTWIQRGGLCKLYIKPENIDQLSKIIIFLYRNKLEFYVLGQTSNVYILDTRNIDIIVSTIYCRSYELTSEGFIRCDAGVLVRTLSKDMIKKGIKGFEYLTELPGTVGGAVHNNSSCKENSISSLLIQIDFIKEDGTMISLSSSDLDFKFRSSILKEGRMKGTIVSLKLRALRGNAEILNKISLENELSRKSVIEGNAHNLGCTVNRCFINGKMPIKYSLPLKIYSKILLYTEKDEVQRKIKSRDFLCKISGFSSIAPYISYKNIIIYKWLDTDADKNFPLYLEFMKRVFKTDKVEIEIIK